MKNLEEKSNIEYIPVQVSQGLQVGLPEEGRPHRAFQLSEEKDQHPQMKGQAQKEARYQISSQNKRGWKSIRGQQ